MSCAVRWLARRAAHPSRVTPCCTVQSAQSAQLHPAGLAEGYPAKQPGCLGQDGQGSAEPLRAWPTPQNWEEGGRP
eukprot:831966-Pyramimonas_sp.AAC.1